MGDVYQTILTNMGHEIYTGDSYVRAKFEANRAGFECHITRNGTIIARRGRFGCWKEY